MPLTHMVFQASVRSLTRVLVSFGPLCLIKVKCMVDDMLLSAALHVCLTIPMAPCV